MFEKTLEIVEDLKLKSDQENKSLSTYEKLQVAEDCLKLVKDPAEYKEIKQIRDDLKKEWDMERELRSRTGFIKKNPLLVTNDEATKILEIANKEFSAAEKEYLNMKARSEEIEKELKSLQKQMRAIEQGYGLAYSVNSHLPIGYDSIQCQIKASPWIYHHSTAAKAEYKESPEVIGLWRGPSKEVFTR